MADQPLPNWVYDIVIELEEQHERHPKLFFTSGAFEGYQQYDWCSCRLLDKVPDDVREHAAAISAYVHSVSKKDRSYQAPPAGDQNSAENASPAVEDGDAH